MKKRICLMCTFAVIIVGSLIRIWMSIFHFTNCDDLGVAVTMLMKESGSWSIENCIRGFINFGMCQWTYAPLQFVLTCLLLGPELPYQGIIVLGRLPSLICGITVLPLLYFLLKKIFTKSEDDNSSVFILSCIVLITTSFEHIIYSAQMNSYAIGVLGASVCVYLFILNQEKYKDVGTVLLTTLLCYAQWQLFLFVFCFYVAMLWKGVRAKDRFLLFKIVCSGIITVCLNIPNLMFFLHCGMQERGTNWNVGSDGQYLFQINTGDNIIDTILYMFDFVKSNLIECFAFLVLPCKYHIAAYILAIFLILLTILGIVYLHRGSFLQKQIAIFIDLLIIFYAGMIFAGVLTLSPSRHLLVMQPVVLLCLVSGWKFIESLTNRASVFCIVLISLIIFLFFMELPEQLEQRKNRFNAAYWQSIIENYQPDIIVTYAYSLDPFLIDIDGYSIEMEKIDCSFIYKDDFDFQLDKDVRIILFSNAVELDEYWEEKTHSVLSNKLNEHENMHPYIFSWKNLHTEVWGATIEYADRFENGIYGEYIYDIEIESGD